MTVFFPEGHDFMSMDFNASEARFIIDTVREATNLVRTIQSEMVSSALEKEDRSPVTIADFAAQALVGKRLRERFPADALVGEEDSQALQQDAAKMAAVTDFLGRALGEATPEQVAVWIDHGNAKPAARFWTLDPIDGTKGFLRGMQYAVAFALIEDGVVQLAGLGCPHLTDGWKQEVGGPGSLLVARRGQGAYVTPLNGNETFEPVHVSTITDPAEARFLRSFESGHTNISQLDVIGEKMGVAAEPVRLDSQAKYAILACGAGDAIFRLISPKMPGYEEKVWDQAAGSLIAEEAGGRVTDLDGKALDFAQGRTLKGNRGVLVTNGYLHDAALQAIRTVGA
jgi:3'(2'), 5'-bisphosphate nucleotidase